MRPIQEIAATIGLDEKLIVPYGHYKAKIPLESVDTSGSSGQDDSGHRDNPHPSR